MSDHITSYTKSSGLKRTEKMQSLLKRADALKSEQSSSPNLLELCIACDTTGSMSRIFRSAVEACKKIAEEVSETSSARLMFMGYKNHGDEHYFDNENAFLSTGWTDSPDDIKRIMSTVQAGGGGDGLTVIEDVLHALNQSDWTDASKKILILIGDMPPHGVIDSVNRCSRDINYNREIETLKANRVTVYSIYCDTDNGLMGRDRKAKIVEFYHRIAEETGGRFLSLEDVDLLITLLSGISMKEVGRFEDYMKRISASKSISPKQIKALKALE